MHDYLRQIIAHKRTEIEALRADPQLRQLHAALQPSRRGFYHQLAARKAAGMPVLIAEFKRRSPTAGTIQAEADLARQVGQYVAAGAAAISVLTDQRFFGGSFADLAAASAATAEANIPVLCKDFILDAAQVWQARAHGADALLLIAAVLEREQLVQLRDAAHALGMGVLLETHDEDDLAKAAGLDFPVVGVNNRDLRTFRIALNRANAIARRLPPQVLRISESGIGSAPDLRIAICNTDGALVGTSLMHNPQLLAQFSSGAHPPLMFKACGIRNAAHLHLPEPDLIGLNFSARSRRRVDAANLSAKQLPRNAVAVFYQNTPAEREAILARLPFPYVQLYHEDVRPDEVATQPQRVLLAVRGAGELPEAELLAIAEAYAPHVYCFVLDSSQPGSGRAGAAIPAAFPYPFLLAGGITPETAAHALTHPACIGVDAASGIETAGEVDPEKVRAIRLVLDTLTRQPA